MRVEPAAAEQGSPNRLTVAGLYLLFLAIPLSISGMQAGLGLAVAGLVWDMGRGRRRFPRTDLDLPVMLFLALTLVSALFSDEPARGVQQCAGGWTVSGLYLMAACGGQRKLMWRLMQVLFAAAVVVGLYGIFQHLTGVDFIRPGRPLMSLELAGRTVWFPRGAFSHYQTFSNVFYLLFCLALAQGIHSRTGREPRLWKGAALVLGAVMVLSYTRGIWLAALGALVFQASLSGWRKASRVAAAAAAVIVVLAFASAGGLSGRAGTIAEVEGNVERLLLWETTWNMIRDRPLLGVGVGNYQKGQDRYLREDVPATMTRSHSHNNLLQVTVERGVFGLMLFLWIWYLIVKKGFQLLGHLRREGGRNYGLALGGLTGLLGFFVDGLFQNNFGDTEVVILFWLVVGLLFGLRPGAAGSGGLSPGMGDA